MTDHLFHYVEPPHSAFDVLEQTFNDPGDNLGPISFLDAILRDTITKASRGDLDALHSCLKQLGDHEVYKIKKQAWSPRKRRHASFVVEAPPIAEALVILGIASAKSGSTMFSLMGLRIKIEDWVITAANKQRGIDSAFDEEIYDWHDDGSQEQPRTTAVFDL